MRTSSLHEHLPEYLIEAWALGMFMIAAAAAGVWFAPTGLPLPDALELPLVRRALAGVAMGLTAIALVCSRWGRRSGAHLNPAVTLTYLALGRITCPDAVAYVCAQFAGAVLGLQCAAALFGAPLAMPPVSFVITQPGSGGPPVAFAAECAISAGLMFAVLRTSNDARLARATPFVAGALVALYITFEAPLSGMSMNPARSFASALAAHEFSSLWIYFLAPVLGMAAGAALYVRLHGRPHCAKLLHGTREPCIHCGYRPFRSARKGLAQAHSLVSGSTSHRR